MARKQQQKQRPTAPPPAQLGSRVKAALREGHFPQALELAKQLVAHEPSESSRQQLRDVYAAAARHQVNREAWVDARQLLDQAEKFDGPPAWWEALALFRAKTGDETIARQLLAKAPETTVLPKVLGHLADRALRDPRNGKLRLAAELHAGFDLVVAAFAHYEKGDDEAAKQALQAIGLTSPYLDWKLLIRGLMAYAASDDVRALENWQRLDPERLPARLAAPFRFRLDPVYRNSLNGDQARTIGRRADQVSHPLLGSLRDLQRTLGTAETLPKALGLVPPVLAMFKMNFPHLVPKVAHCFYWLIIQGGEPEDLDRYEKIFGRPADDRNFSRLQALVMESYPNYGSAHQFWKEYLDEIARSPEQWPGEFGRRALATILVRMGDNALEYETDEDDDLDELFELFSPTRRRKKPTKATLVPSAEACYRQAMQLAPDWKPPAQRLMLILSDAEKLQEAEQVGMALLERFPDDVKILMQVSSIRQALGKTAAAVDLMRRALKTNPLDRTLRAGVGLAALHQGRDDAAAGRFDQARACFREAIDLDPGVGATIGRVAWAACEYKEGNPEKAAALMAEVGTKPEQRLASTYYLAVECGRVKVAKPLLKEMQGRLDEALAGAPSIPELNALAQALSFYRRETPAYRGIGTHEKKIHALLQKAASANPPEEDLVQIGFCLMRNRIHKVLKLCADQGERRFPNSPIFAFFRAEQAVLQRPKTFSVRNVGFQYRRVLRQIKDLTDERSRMMRDAIDERVKEYPDLEMWVRPSIFPEMPW